jgi:MFS family permease
VALHGTVLAWQVLLPLAVGVVLLAGYAVHALRPRTAAPLIELRLFARRSFTAGVVAAAVLGLATFASIFAIPLYYQQVRDFGVFEAGLLLAPYGLGSAIVMPLAGQLSDRLGSRLPALVGAGFALVASVAFTTFGPTTPLLLPLPAAFVLGIGTGTAGAPVIGSVCRTLPVELVPQGSSVLYMLNQLGAATGIAVVALLVQAAGDPVTGFRSAYLGVVVALLLMVVAATQIPGRPAPAGGKQASEETGAAATESR